MANNSQIPLQFQWVDSQGRLTQPAAFWLSNNNSNAAAGAAAAANPANQTITLSGDVTGTGTSAITTTLSTVNSSAGTYGGVGLIPVITVDEKGRVTSVFNQAIIGGNGTVTSVGINSSTLTVQNSPVTTNGVINVNIPNTTVTPGTYTNSTITVNAQGRITNASTGSGGGGDGQVPYYVPDGESFTVNINKQCLFIMPIELAGSGYLEVDGYLIEL